MSGDNPYQPPDQPRYNPQVDPASQADAVGKVSGPAIALIVVGVLNIVWSLWGLAQSVMVVAGLVDVREQQADALEQLADADLPPGFLDFMEMWIDIQGPVGLGGNLLTLVIAAVIIMGALKMKNLKSLGMAKTASILAMIPCLSSCCCIGLPIGIWSLVVLADATVQAGFQARAQTFSPE